MPIAALTLMAKTCAEPLSLAVGQLLPEQFLEIVRFEQRSRLAELPEELVRGQDVFVYPPIWFP